MNLEKTYCNPTPLPDYPIGRTCYYRNLDIHFRETADPSVIYEDGKWYLYSSCGMMYLHPASATVSVRIKHSVTKSLSKLFIDIAPNKLNYTISIAQRKKKIKKINFFQKNY